MMTEICLSSHHMQAVNELSPCRILKRKNLFPTDSPQSHGLGFISSLTPSPEVYSPPLTSPNWSDLSENDIRQSLALTELKFDDILCGTDKHIKPLSTITDYSIEKESEFKDVLNGLVSPVNISVCSEFKEKKTPIGISTFPNNTKISKNCKSIKNSQVEPPVIKPVNFYGPVHSQSAHNHDIYSQYNKGICPLTQQSKVKTKLFLDDRSVNEKRERSHSNDNSKRYSKRKKDIFTGVHHRIFKPKPKPKKEVPRHSQPLRSKIKNEFDFSRTPYVLHKRYKTGWEYPKIIRKPERVEAENSGKKRKFFKTTLKESPVFSLSNSPREQPKKKRKLFDFTSDFGNNVTKFNSTDPPLSASDMLDLIEEGVNEKEIDMEQRHVEDLISQLEDDKSQAGINRQEIRELLDSFQEIEDSEEDEENKRPILSVANLTASTATLTMNSSDQSLEGSDKNGKEMSDQLFPIFNHNYKSNAVLADVTNKVRPHKKNMWRPMGNDQYQIDAGQKKFGEKQCSECGLLYQQGDPDDEIQHSVYHSNFQTLRFVGWKNENIVGYYGADKVIVVKWDDPKVWHVKCASILAIVDKELGIMSESSVISSNMKVFMYISEKQVVGCLVGMTLSRAYKLYESTTDMTTCSEESYPVKCGICRLWTHPAYRRQGIASKLVDTLRRNFVYGYILSRDDIAFSVPTPDGKSFVTKYVGKNDFFVFTGY